MPEKKKKRKIFVDILFMTVKQFLVKYYRTLVEIYLYSFAITSIYKSSVFIQLYYKKIIILGITAHLVLGLADRLLASYPDRCERSRNQFRYDLGMVIYYGDILKLFSTATLIPKHRFSQQIYSLIHSSRPL
jgi:hypothetical protein